MKPEELATEPVAKEGTLGAEAESLGFTQKDMYDLIEPILIKHGLFDGLNVNPQGRQITYALLDAVVAGAKFAQARKEN